MKAGPRKGNGHSRWMLVIALCVIFAPACPAAARAQSHRRKRLTSRNKVTYRIDLSRRHRNLLDITMRFRARLPVEIAIPIWAPGAYRRQHFERKIRSLKADCPKRPLALTRLSSNRWIIARSPASPKSSAVTCAIRVRYRVLADALDDDASHVDASHAALVGTSVFLFVPRLRQSPHQVDFTLPAAWRAFTALEPTTATPTTSTSRKRSFIAASYDALVDAPFELSDAPFYGAPLGGGRQLTVVLHDTRRPRMRTQIPVTLITELQKIIARQQHMMGHLPYRRYLVLIHLRPQRHYVALEHAASTSVIAPPRALRWPHRNLMHILAHEHFHIYNGKRIRVVPFQRYDYLKAQPSRLLWLTEGLTEYFAVRSLLANGQISAGAYLGWLGELITALRNTPDRHQRSLSEVSLAAWTPWRRAKPRKVSYYNKGHLVGLLLDLELRRRTHGKVTLLSVMRALDRRVKSDRPLALDQKRFAQLFPKSMRPWLHQMTTKPGDLPIERALRWVGLALRIKPTKTNTRTKTNTTTPTNTPTKTNTPTHRSPLRRRYELVPLDRLTKDAMLLQYRWLWMAASALGGSTLQAL
jgi:predicted metalloprotease with PDZ domain